MGFGIGFSLSRSGLDGAQKAIDAIGHNIANSQTVGFKSSRVRFADVFARGAGLGGTNGGSNASGVMTPSVIQRLDDQGSLETTGNALDVAITGRGFFRFQQDAKKGTEITYSRNGQFAVSFEGYSAPDTPRKVKLISRDDASLAGSKLTDGSGVDRSHEIHYVTGYAGFDPVSNPAGDIIYSDPPVPLEFSSKLPPRATENVRVAMNFDADVPSVISPFDASNPATFNHVVSTKVWSDTGDKLNLMLYLSRTSVDPATKISTWQVNARIADTTPTGNAVTRALGSAQTMMFGSDGKLVGSSGLLSFAALDPADGTSGMSSMGPLSVDLSGTREDSNGIVQSYGAATQFGGTEFTVQLIEQDGFPEGDLQQQQDMRIDSEGVIWGKYSNGQSRRLGQIALTSFTNQEALVNIGDGMWQEDPDKVLGTGEPLNFPPSTRLMGNLARLTSGAVESSNVDLATELVALIEQQRNYQASAQTFKSLDEALRNLAAIR